MHDGVSMSYRSSRSSLSARALAHPGLFATTLAVVLAGSLAGSLASCGGDDTNNVTGLGPATVRFVNASNAGIEVSNGGVVESGNNNLGFGASSACMSASATGTALGFTLAGSGTVLPGFTQKFTPAGNFTVVAFPNGTLVQFATASNSGFAPDAGGAGLRVFNALSSTDTLLAFANGELLGTGQPILFGTASSFATLPAGFVAITLKSSNGSPTVISATTIGLTANERAMLVIAPPAGGTPTPRTFVATSC